MPNSEDFLPPAGQALKLAFKALIETLNERPVRYALIGGLATIQHTRIRTTDDIDVLLSVSQLAMPGLFEALGSRGFSLEVRQSVNEFRESGLTLIRYRDVIVDLLAPVIPAYSHVLDRAVTREVLGLPVRVSSAEGLIVMKLISMRPQDEADILELIAACGDDLDLEFIRAELNTIAGPADPRRAKFDGWIQGR